MGHEPFLLHWKCAIRRRFVRFLWSFSTFHFRIVAIIFEVVVQQEFAGKLLETMITTEIFLVSVDEDVMGFRFGRFEYFVTDFASGKWEGEGGLREQF